MKKDQSLALLVDGADLVQDGRGQPNSDWLPQQVPKVSHMNMNEVKANYLDELN